MRITVTGATGTIGQALAGELVAAGHSVVALSRDAARGRRMLAAGVEVLEWGEPLQTRPPVEALAEVDAVIHLLGETISQRWDDQSKRRIRASRVESTGQLVAALSALPEASRPRVLVSQSATGFYGPLGEQPVDETGDAGHGFLAGVVVEWERAAAAAESIMRVVRTRTGVVLSREGGALAKMLPFFRLGIGGPVAGGAQYVSWVHLEDVAGALRLCAETEGLSGAVNVTAPQPVSNAELSRALGRALHRPAVLPVPGIALRLLYGEMSEIVTTGQRVLPRRLEDMGYTFRHPALAAALADVIGGSG